jgi:serine acetyltransferase/dTDP-4-dehydrorhamnose 3,5-epimerase-like enzyme
MSSARQAVIAPDAQIAPSVHLGDAVVVGAATRVAAGAYLGDGSSVGARVRIGGNATLADCGEGMTGVTIQDDVVIGAGSTIEAAVTIAAKAHVMAGAVVTRAVPPGAIVEGNPASIVGYVGALAGDRPVDQRQAPAGQPVETTTVRGVTVHHFPVIPDMRGSLTVGEFDKQIPFVPRRYFMVFGVPSREVRGEHAHRECHQFLICVRGSCSVMADDGDRRIEIALDSPNKGVYLPPMTWGVQYKYSADAMLLVFASDYYDNKDYVRDYAEYLQLVRGLGASQRPEETT